MIALIWLPSRMLIVAVGFAPANPIGKGTAASFCNYCSGVACRGLNFWLPITLVRKALGQRPLTPFCSLACVASFVVLKSGALQELIRNQALVLLREPEGRPRGFLSATIFALGTFVVLGGARSAFWGKLAAIIA